MAADVPTSAPTRATAGDTWTWEFAHDADYPAPDWVVSYAIRGIDAPAWDPDWVTVADQVSTIEIPASITAPLRGGVYALTRFLTNGTRRVSTGLAWLAVADNPAALQPGAARPWQEAALEAVESQLAGKAGSGMQSYMIAGRQMMSYSLTELRSLRSMLIAELRLLRGLESPGVGRRIPFAFVSPR